MAEAVIVAAGRSPIGRAVKGSLAGERADDLAAAVVSALLGRLPEAVAREADDVMLGCAQPAGEQGYNMARVVSVLAGLGHVPGTTVNRYCASSVQTMRMAFHAIRAGEGSVFIAAGVETASRFAMGKSDGMPDTKNPKFMAAMERSQMRAGGGHGVWEPATGLPDVYIAMGQTAENVADVHGVSREAMDAFALRSHQRAVAAQDTGVFDSEIIPITRSDGVVVSRDDGPRSDTSLERLASLAPAFRPDGTVTAGNACPLNDGAAAVVIMSDVRARELGITPLARIVSTGVSALDPEIMGMGPVEATQRALALAGMTMADVDLVEINEAFAAQVIPSAEMLTISDAKLNVHGGAIALGHPFGMTGARLAGTLINALQRTNGSIGVETMCVGGGQGMALVLERLS